MLSPNPEDFEPVNWADVRKGDEVYLDHYLGGRYPKANPRIAGPFIVTSTEHRRLRTTVRRYNTTFMNYPEQLLRRKE